MLNLCGIAVVKSVFLFCIVSSVAGGPKMYCLNLGSLMHKVTVLIVLRCEHYFVH